MTIFVLGYVLGVATLPLMALIYVGAALTVLPDATTSRECRVCDWRVDSRIPVRRWASRLWHYYRFARRPWHVRRLREHLASSNYRQDIIDRFDRKHAKQLRAAGRERTDG